MVILIADDQPDVRSALRLLLEQETGACLECEAATGEAVLAEARRMVPDLLLIDCELPGPPLEALLAGLRRISSDLVVIALSGRPGARQMALAAGVDYFVSKADPPEGLLEAVRAATSTIHARGG